MLELLIAFPILFAPFVIVAFLALRHGAETRPFWDERPYDGRPNL